MSKELDEESPLLNASNAPNSRDSPSSSHRSQHNIWRAVLDGGVVNSTFESEDEDLLRYLELEERRRKLSSLFGVKPFAGSVSRAAQIQSHARRRHLYSKPNVPNAPPPDVKLHSIDNLLWALLFGWLLALVYIVTGVVLALTIVCWPYARKCFALSAYFIWPFGKYLVRNESVQPATSCRCPHIIPFILWCLLSLPLIGMHAAIFVITWYTIIFIPMAKVNYEAIRLLYTHPLQMEVSTDAVGGMAILLCSHHAINFGYIKYSVMDGFNVLMTNFSLLAFFVIIFGFGQRAFTWMPVVPDILMFVMSLCAMIPLAYFVGMAIGRISAQSTPAMGAFLNATFGSLVDIILYCSAISTGSLDVLVKASVVGSLLLCLLFFPGVSMIAGGFKFSEQSFNSLSAGVTSELLLVSVMGALIPTVFYHAYGSYEVICRECYAPTPERQYDIDCSSCVMVQALPHADPTYSEMVQPLIYVCCALLPLAYAIGLLFTLKTHAKQLYALPLDSANASEDGEVGGGGGGAHGDDDGGLVPVWSRTKSFFVLLVSTVLFGLVAEVLVDSTGPTIDQLGLSQRFVGVTVIAFVPSVTEFINSIRFALQNNIALSVEVAASYSVQITLIQIPVLVFFSAAFRAISTSSTTGFTMIFDGLDVFSILLSVLVINYVFSSPRTNYFEGASLAIIYAIIVSAYYFAPEKGHLLPPTPVNATDTFDILTHLRWKQ